MIIGAEIALLVVGIYALIAGKLPVAKRAKHVVTGWHARVIGVIALLPLPVSFVIASAVAMLFVARGKTITQESFFWVGTAIEGGVLLVCLLVIAILSRLWRIPVLPEPVTGQL